MTPKAPLFGTVHSSKPQRAEPFVAMRAQGQAVVAKDGVIGRWLSKGKYAPGLLGAGMVSGLRSGGMVPSQR